MPPVLALAPRMLSMSGGIPTEATDGPILIYAPGTIQHGNIFPDMTSLQNAAIRISGPKTIWTDGINAPGDGLVHIPTGAWTLGAEVTFASDAGTLGQPNTVGATVVFDDGATLDTIPVCVHNCALESKSTAPIVVDATVGLIAFVEVSGLATLTSTTASMFQATDPGAELFVAMHDNSALNNSGSFVFDAPAIAITGNDNAFVDTNVLNASGNILFGANGTSQINRTQGGAGATVTGVIINTPTNQTPYVGVGLTVANTAAASSIVGPSGASAGSMIIPTNHSGFNQAYELDLSGVVSTDAVAPTLAIAISIGGDVLVTTGAVLMAAGLVNAVWRLRLKLVANSGNTWYVQGWFEYQVANPGPLTAHAISSGAADAPVAAFFGLLDVLATWGAAAVDNSIFAQNATLAVAGPNLI